MSRFLTAIADLFFPPRCMICHKIVERKQMPVCEKCLCSLPEHDGADPEVRFSAQSVATFFYEKDLREAFLRYKFLERTFYAEQFGKWMSVTVKDKLAGKYDLVSYVPVSKKRRRKRGYDQTELLCKALCRELGTQPTETLVKHRDTKAQSSLRDASERRANAAGAYAAVHPERFAGKRILLIDDILTTGATLCECCRVLQTAGAADVVCAVLATPRNGGERKTL